MSNPILASTTDGQTVSRSSESIGGGRSVSAMSLLLSSSAEFARPGNSGYPWTLRSQPGPRQQPADRPDTPDRDCRLLRSEQHEVGDSQGAKNWTHRWWDQAAVLVP